MQTESRSTAEVFEGIFKEGGKYTLFKIDNVLAMTHKTEITVLNILDGRIIWKERGKRKEFLLKFESRSYASAPLNPLRCGIFEGWDQPITCDTDQYNKPDQNGVTFSRVMRGNACYNFVGDPAQIREWIDSKQLNPYFEKVRVLAVGGSSDYEFVVYPELFQGGHAVIERILSKQQDNLPHDAPK